MKNNRIGKVASQIKEDQTKPANHAGAQQYLFNSENERPSEAALRLAQELAAQLGFTGKGLSILDILKSATERLKTVPYIQYPTSFSTVDVAPIAYNPEDGKRYVLLGRKPGQTQFQLLGGFRDPAETNEVAASRELAEEAGVIVPLERFIHVKNLFIDDNRYKDSCHKVTTTLFLAMIEKNEMEKFSYGDDIEETRWFPLDGSVEFENIVRTVHQELFKEVISAIELL